MRAHLTYANVASTLALALALGGGAAVAASVAKDSVGSRQIINGSVKSTDLNPRAVPKSITVSSPSTRGILPNFGDSGREEGLSAVSFIAPRAGTAVVTVEAQFNGKEGSDFVTGELVVDGERFAAFFDWDTGDFDGYNDQRQTASFTVPIAKGERTFAVNLLEGSGAARPASEYAYLTTRVQYVSGRAGLVAPQAERVTQPPQSG